MKALVSNNILQQTTLCNSDFLCLKSDWKPCGNFLGKIGSWIIHESVDDLDRMKCAYRTQLGTGHYCTCPTRLEIHRLKGF